MQKLRTNKNLFNSLKLCKSYKKNVNRKEIIKLTMEKTISFSISYTVAYAREQR